MRTFLRRSTAAAAFLFLALAAGPAFALIQESLPPKPEGYFTDQAGLVDAATASALNEQLAQFERDTSNQILVAIYPQLPDGADLAQYCIDTGNAWRAGQKGTDNAAVLFVFAHDHQMFIATGRGLEGALPDITCSHIIQQEIVPKFRQGDYAGGVQAGVAAMMAATKGEYQGSGQTVEEQGQGSDNGGAPAWFVVVFVLILIILIWSRSSGAAGPFIYTGGGFGGSGFGGSGRGGGFGGGGGGGFSGFSGGGGSFGGGGAGGSW